MFLAGDYNVRLIVDGNVIFAQYMAAGCGLAMIRLHMPSKSADQDSIGPKLVVAQSTPWANCVCTDKAEEW